MEAVGKMSLGLVHEICHLLNCVPLITHHRTTSLYKTFSFLHINPILGPGGSQLHNKTKATPYIMNSIPNTMNYNLGTIDGVAQYRSNPTTNYWFKMQHTQIIYNPLDNQQMDVQIFVC